MNLYGVVTVTVADSGFSVNVSFCVVVCPGPRVVVQRLPERDPDGEDEQEHEAPHDPAPGLAAGTFAPAAGGRGHGR